MGRKDDRRDKAKLWLKTQKLPDEEFEKRSVREKASTPKMAISYNSQAHILFPNWVPETAWCIEESLLLGTLLSQLLHTERETNRQAHTHKYTLCFGTEPGTSKRLGRN